MELKEFVKGVLKDVLDAVNEAKEGSTHDMYLTTTGERRTVEFDIAVTVEDGTTAEGKAGIRVLSVIEGGGNISKESKNSTVSRIQFGVTVGSMSKTEQAALAARMNQPQKPDWH